MHATVHVINVTHASHYCDRVETITGFKTLCAHVKERKKIHVTACSPKKKKKKVA